MPPMQFSRRAARLAESATLQMTRRVAELRAAGCEIVDLSAGQPDFPSPAAAVAAARQALADGFTRYTPAAGIPELRRALARRYAERHGAPWGSANVVVTVGAKAALFELIQILVDDGDEAVLPFPAWVSFPQQIRLAGGRPIAVATAAAERFAIRAEPLLAAVGEKTRLVLVNSPSNPTGAMAAAGDLRRIVEHCAGRGIAVVSDETYDRFVYGGPPFASAAALAAEFPRTVVVVGSFSKTYSMTGWRVGFCLGPQELIARVAALQGHVTGNATSFAMRGALAALEGAEEEIAARLAELAGRRDLLVRRLGRIPGVACQPPQGALYAFPHVAEHYRDGRRGSLELAEHLLETAGVALVPGVAFGADDHLRISFAGPRRELEAGLERLEEALSR